MHRILVASAPICARTGKALAASLRGETFGLPLSQSAARDFGVTFGSSPMMWPQHESQAPVLDCAVLGPNASSACDEHVHVRPHIVAPPLDRPPPD